MTSMLNLTKLRHSGSLLLVLVLSLGGSHSAYGQLKLSDQGNVTVGSLGESTAEKMTVTCNDEAECGDRVLYARYSGLTAGIDVVGIYGEIPGSNGTGVRGSGGAFGVYGESASGAGVHGTGNTYGVYGESSNSVGVYGLSVGAGGSGVRGMGGAYGLYGESAGANGVGVHGAGGARGVYGTGSAFGLYGEGTGTNATGVYGVGTTGTGSVGVRGLGEYGLYAEGYKRGVSGVGESHGVYGSVSAPTGTGDGFAPGFTEEGFLSFTAGGFFRGGEYGGYLLGDDYGVYGRSSNPDGTGVHGTGEGYGVFGQSASGVGVHGEGNTGIYGEGESRGVHATGDNYGVYGSANASGSGVTGHAYGTSGIARNDDANAYGAKGYAYVYGGGDAIGLHGEVGSVLEAYSGGVSAFGVYAKATNGVKSSYGLYATASSTEGDVYAGYFNGNVTITGRLTESSDARLKRNIQDLPAAEALTRVRQLQPRTFRYRPAAIENLNLPEGLQLGFIAQEVESLVPQLVEEQTHTIFRGGGIDPETGESTEPEELEVTFKTLDYVGLIPVLTAALQQQQAQIDLLVQTLLNNGLEVPPELTAGL